MQTAFIGKQTSKRSRKVLLLSVCIRFSAGSESQCDYRMIIPPTACRQAEVTPWRLSLRLCPAGSHWSLQESQSGRKKLNIHCGDIPISSLAIMSCSSSAFWSRLQNCWCWIKSRQNFLCVSLNAAQHI